MERIGIIADIPSSNDNMKKFGSLIWIIWHDENTMKKSVLKCYKFLS
jgi:hypothetical protein